MTRTELNVIRGLFRRCVRDIVRSLGENRRGGAVAAEPVANGVGLDWKGVVGGWLEGARGELPQREGRVYVTPALVLERALGVTPARSSGHGTVIHRLLVELGWRRGDRIRVGGVKVTPYWAPAPAGASAGDTRRFWPAPQGLTEAEVKEAGERLRASGVLEQSTGPRDGTSAGRVP